MQTAETRRWRFKGPEMEGPIARWYARIRGSESQLATYHAQAAQLTAGLPEGAQVLEVAPGPGYLAIEMARLGHRVATLDISQTFVEIGAENARNAGVAVDARRGDVAQMPFGNETFDLVVCQAAFKNFTLPHSALAEMHRVLRPGRMAVIQDMNSQATHAEIEHEVDGMGLGPWNTFTTKATLEMLKRRAYTPARFQELAQQSPFQGCEVSTDGIGLEVRLSKSEA